MTVGEAVFVKSHPVEDNTMFSLKLDDGGCITVLDRLTGYGYGYGIRDIETGYRAKDGKFWLASGMFDIREWPEKTLEEAVEFIKSAANTCVGD